MPTGIALSRRHRRRMTREIIPNCRAAWKVSSLRENLVDLPAVMPDDISGLELWLDANDVSLGLVSSWVDKTGNYTFTQSIDSKKPTCVAFGLGHNKAIRFSGAQLLVSTALSAASEGTVFIIARELESNQKVFLASCDEATSSSFWRCGKNTITAPEILQRNLGDLPQESIRGATNPVSTNFRRYCYDSSGTAYRLFLDEVEETLTITSGSNNGDWLGDTGGRENTSIGAIKNNTENTFLNGYIVSIIVYNRSLTDTERGQVHAYLKAQYEPKLFDISGNGRHAYFGGINSIWGNNNSPIFLPYEEKKRVYNTGVNNNYIVTPHSSAINITGEIEMVHRGDVQGSATRTLASKRNVASNWSYRWEINTTPRMLLVLSNDGTTEVSVSSSVNCSLGQKWRKVTWRPSDGRVQFWEAPDQETEPTSGEWVQIGANATIAIASIYSGTSGVQIGALGTTQSFEGYIDYFILRSGIDGTTVASFDANSSTLIEPYSTWTDSQGNVWSFNRSSSGKKLTIVDRDMLLFGSDDYLDIADHSSLNFNNIQGFTAAIALRVHTFGTTEQAYVAKKVSQNTADVGWYLHRGSTAGSPRLQARISDGTISRIADDNIPTPDGVSTLFSLIRDVNSDELKVIGMDTLAVTSDTTTGTLSNSESLRIGRRSGGSTSYADMIFFGTVISDLLSFGDLNLLEQELLA